MGPERLNIPLLLKGIHRFQEYFLMVLTSVNIMLGFASNKRRVKSLKKGVFNISAVLVYTIFVK